jgi:hypothetical protein
MGGRARARGTMRAASTDAVSRCITVNDEKIVIEYEIYFILRMEGLSVNGVKKGAAQMGKRLGK